ncbi:hypothetical protein BKA64DRAFT_723364 [Cadophora sp. MPI-SDFR-AT-0126]|nr:hypothetical protein BKA64DRAFT_723364 [Leotiomycetes sp. MPI-SDFR-AT-0126]
MTLKHSGAALGSLVDLRPHYRTWPRASAGANVRGSEIEFYGAVTTGHRDLSQLEGVLASQRTCQGCNLLIAFVGVGIFCINQEDLDERSQQIPLMSSIYKNASRVIVDNFEDLVNRENRERYESTAIGPDLILMDLPQHPAWDDVVDIFASRTVFSRLWTLQETILASGNQVSLLCGGVEMPWDTFSDIAYALGQCVELWMGFLTRTEMNTMCGILTDISIRRKFQRRKDPLPKQSLKQVLVTCMHVLVTDERDRVFGILALFDEDTRKRFSHLGYNNSSGEIFRAVTEIILDNGQGLEYLQWIPAVHSGRSNSMLECPSWVWMVDNWRLNNRLYSDMELLDLTDTRYKPVIKGDEFIAWGLVLDSVTFASPNISPNESLPREHIRPAALNFSNKGRGV